MAYGLLKVLTGIIIAVIITIVGVAGIHNIPVGQVAVTTHYGELQEGILTEGWKYITPVSDAMITYDTRIQLYPKPLSTYDGQQEVPMIVSTSSDGQDVPIKFGLNYHVNQGKVYDIHKKIGTNYEFIVIKNVVENTIKDVMGKYTADFMYQNREEVAKAIEVKLSHNLKNYDGCRDCFELDRFSIANIEFKSQFADALERKATAKTDAETAWNKVEELKALAQQKIESAKGDAESIRVVNEALAQSPNYVEWLKVKTLQEKWDGALPKVTGSGTPLINVPLN